MLQLALLGLGVSFATFPTWNQKLQRSIKTRHLQDEIGVINGSNLILIARCPPELSGNVTWINGTLLMKKNKVLSRCCGSALKRLKEGGRWLQQAHTQSQQCFTKAHVIVFTAGQDSHYLQLHLRQMWSSAQTHKLKHRHTHVHMVFLPKWSEVNRLAAPEWSPASLFNDFAISH